MDCGSSKWRGFKVNRPSPITPRDICVTKQGPVASFCTCFFQLTARLKSHYAEPTTSNVILTNPAPNNTNPPSHTNFTFGSISQQEVGEHQPRRATTDSQEEHTKTKHTLTHDTLPTSKAKGEGEGEQQSTDQYIETYRSVTYKQQEHTTVTPPRKTTTKPTHGSSTAKANTR